MYKVFIRDRKTGKQIGLGHVFLVELVALEYVFEQEALLGHLDVDVCLERI